ncbi:hypothetical protein O3S81_03810 [Agrobacterium sp. SOY23]|nr:hypothetical protein [Agrobacterium sp. SOY23]MCZ4428818.1 hypothetical protein [Agrobacterium sp. SOY23]
MDGRQSRRAAVAAGYRRCRRSVTPTGGTPLPAGNGPLARALLSRNPPRPRTASADPVRNARR